MPIEIEDADLNFTHIALRHIGRGEMTLCGKYIDYDDANIWDEKRPPMCPICEERS